MRHPATPPRGLLPLAAVAALLAQHYRLPAARVRRVARSDGEVFRVAVHNPGRPEFAFRVYAAARQDATSIGDELTWLAELAARGLQVPRPIAAHDGSVLQHLPGSAGSTPRHAVLLTWLPGRMLYAGLRPVHLRRCGELLAGLHATADQLLGQGRLTARRGADGVDLMRWAQGERKRSPHMSITQHHLARLTAARVLSEYDRHREADVRGFIHGDLHPWNILFIGGRCGVIDFSDCGMGSLMQDLASVLQFLKHPLPQHHDHRTAYPALRDALFQGLGGTLMARPGAAGLLDAHITARMLGTLQWICDDWRHPEERRWGPAFIRQCESLLREYVVH